jgi:hypothetical protein
MRRTSSSSEYGLDPAYGADDVHGQHASDCPTSRAILLSKTSQDRRPTVPLASTAALGTVTARAAAASNGEESESGSGDGEEGNLEKLEEIVRSDEGISNQLVITIP